MSALRVSARERRILDTIAGSQVSLADLVEALAAAPRGEGWTLDSLVSALDRLRDARLIVGRRAFVLTHAGKMATSFPALFLADYPKHPDRLGPPFRVKYRRIRPGLWGASAEGERRHLEAFDATKREAHNRLLRSVAGLSDYLVDKVESCIGCAASENVPCRVKLVLSAQAVRALFELTMAEGDTKLAKLPEGSWVNVEEADIIGRLLVEAARRLPRRRRAKRRKPPARTRAKR